MEQWTIDRLDKILSARQQRLLDELCFETIRYSAIYVPRLQKRLDITERQSQQLSDYFEKVTKADAKRRGDAFLKIRKMLKDRGEELPESVILYGPAEVYPELWEQLYLKEQREADSHYHEGLREILGATKMRKLDELVQGKPESPYYRARKEAKEAKSKQ